MPERDARPASEEPDERFALAWLFGFADWERGVGWNPRAAPEEAWKLGRTRALLDLDGAPDRRLRVVTVAGTNGKGSTGAVIESIVRASGGRVGVYSQPHLHNYRERVRVDGVPLAPDRFVAGVERLRELVDELRRVHPEAGEPTTFELTTVLAVRAFADAGVGLVVLEVGLGGRLDAVNAIDPQLVLLTSIGLDHTRILGRTLAAIAREKAGVLRTNVLALSAPQRPVVRRTLSASARDRGARLRFVPSLPATAPVEEPARGQPVGVRFGEETRPAMLKLLGAHQRENAALAIAAAAEIGRRGWAAITADAVVSGLASARWPGRLEWIPPPADGRPPTLIDGAHNPPGAEALAQALDELAPNVRFELVFGCAGDKNARDLLRPLVRRAATVRTAAAQDQRAADPARLARLAHDLGSSARAYPSVAAAIEAAHGAEPELVVVAGSLRVVAEAREALGVAGS